MSERVRCAGRVVDGVGRPVPHALIMILDGPAPVPEIALVADEEGRFAVALAAGEWTVQARGEAGVGTAKVTVGPPATEFVIEIR